MDEEEFFVVTKEKIGREEIPKNVINGPFSTLEKAITYLNCVYIPEVRSFGSSSIDDRESKIIKGKYVTIKVSYTAK